MIDYWKDCIAEGLCDAGIEATEAQVLTVADWVECAHENYGMATGEEFIPNPENEEIEQLKRKIKAIEASHERQVNGILKGVAQRRRVSVSDVSVDADGIVTYS
jgi:hypothetical protein